MKTLMEICSSFAFVGLGSLVRKLLVQGIWPDSVVSAQADGERHEFARKEDFTSAGQNEPAICESETARQPEQSPVCLWHWPAVR